MRNRSRLLVSALVAAISGCGGVAAGGTRGAIAPKSAWPSDCDEQWRLDGQSLACRRDGHIDVLARVDGSVRMVASVPAAPIYDVSDDEGVLVGGPCSVRDENAANAVCVIPPPAAPGTEPVVGTVYLFAATLSEPGFARGAVVAGENVLATNGRMFASSHYDNMNGAAGPEDVQAQLVAAGIKPATCARWTVLEALHREGGAFVIVFEDCSARRVRVTVGLSSEGTLELHEQPRVTTRSNP